MKICHHHILTGWDTLNIPWPDQADATAPFDFQCYGDLPDFCVKVCSGRHRQCIPSASS